MPDFTHFSLDIVPVAQATGTGTTAPVDAPAEVEGSNMTFVIIGIAVVLLIVLVAVAVRSFRPSKDGDAPRKVAPDDVARPTRDLLADRDEVDEQSEITESDSLAEVKKKKRERVKKSYAEARKELQARKADQVTQDQQRKIQEDAVEAPDDDEAAADAAPETTEASDASEAAQAGDDASEAAHAGDDASEDSQEESDAGDAAEAAAQDPSADESETEANPASADAVASTSFLDEINAGWEDMDEGDLSMSLGGLPELDQPEDPSPDPEPEVVAADAEQEEAAEAVAEEAQPDEAQPDEAQPEQAAETKVGTEEAEQAEAVADVEEPQSEVAQASTELDAAAAAPREEPKALSAGLEKTRGGFVSRLGSLFKRKQEIDGELLDELEEVLYTADMGPKSVETLLNRVQTELDANEISDPSTVWQFIRDETQRILSERQRSLEIPDDVRPFVVLVVGVNGVGKTTTIGKLAMRFTDAGHKTLMVAGDTFRAAATEQLEEWGERTGLAVHTGEDKEDPASVVFSGIQRAKDEGFDVVLCDTAGRLTNKKNLMKELEKIGRVASKAEASAPHETLLVLDANTGMMAVHQARMFQEVVDISGIVLTKLDGTAKGGVIIGISEELQVPVQYIGIGEGVYDLRPFDAKEFVDALYM